MTTQAVGDNTTKIASTAYVDRAARGPTFSAYLAVTGGSVPNATFTKGLFDTELWDTANNFTASRFTPTVAGYYQINASYQIGTPAPGLLTIYKNGAEAMSVVM